MKRFTWLLTLLLILTFALAACGGGNDETPTEEAPATEEEATTEEEAPVEEDAPAEEEAMGEGSIAVLLPDSASSARWEADDRRFLEAAFQEAGVEYSIVNAEGDARTQQTQAEQAITNGAKVILMVNLDSGSGAAIIAQAREAGVKVIDYDRLTIEGDGADYYVSFDNEAVGRLQGEGIVKAIEEAGLANPRVAVLNGSPTDNNATLFANGYNSVITPYFESGEWTLVDDQSVPDWDNQQALVIFEQMLTAAGGEIDAAVAANDGLGGAVSAALKNQGLDQIPVTGQDATAAGIQRVLAGEQSMTVYKAIKAEAEAAASLAIALLNGEDPGDLVTGAVNNGTNDIPSVLLVPVSVTKDNVEETVIADGFRTWDEICVGDYAAYCEDGGAAEEEAMEEEAMIEGSIAVLLPDSASSARWEADDRRFLEAAFQEAGVEYSIVNAEGDARTQQTQAEQAITNGAKVILMVNLDSGSGAAIIAQAREAGVAVIDYDRLTIEGDGADYYVSFDNEAVGRLQGEGIVKAIEEAGLENPRVAVLNGSPTDNNATLFANGYNSVITPYFESGEWTLVDDQSVPDWDNQQALVIFEQMLTAAGGEIDAAVAANDGLGGAVSAALKNQGLDQIPVTGQDATAAGIQRVLAGEQSMTVYKAIKAEAEAAAALAVALLKGEDPGDLVSGAVNNGTNDIPSVLLVPVSVTKDNVEETVIADGFRTWDEICVGDYEQYCP